MMGYHNRLGRVAKHHKDAVSGMTYKQAAEYAGKNGAVYRPTWHTELYEIGKYFSFQSEHLTAFYDTFDVSKECESEFYILTKEGLKELIAYYHSLVHEGLQEIASDENRRQHYVDCKLRNWDAKDKYNILPYWLDEENTDGEIVRSWDMEYAIFNLVHIYRTFKWDDDYLIYSGW